MSLQVKDIFINAFQEEIKEDPNYNKYKEDFLWFGKECQINLLLELVNKFKDKKDLEVRQFSEWAENKIKEIEPPLNEE